MPSIEPRPHKGERVDRPTTWHLKWDLPRGPDGKRRRVQETFHGTKTAATERWHQRNAELAAAGPRYTPPTKMTVGAWLAQWLATYGKEQLEESTYRSYESLVRVHITPYLGHIELAHLTAAEVQRWQAQLAAKISRTGRPLSARRRAYARQVLRAAINEARRERLITDNPVTLVRPPRQHPKQVESFTREQMRTLDEALGKLDDSMAVIPTFAWQTGMRLGEILALQWGDIDWQTRMVSVQRALVENPRRPPIFKDYPKTSKGFRTIRLTSRLMALLEPIRGEGQALVFSRPDGRPLAERAVETFFKKVRDAAGLPPYPFHALRHTFASLGLQAGIDIVAISKMLGHKSFAFTAQTYAHVLDATLQAAFNRFDRFVSDTQDGDTNGDILPG